MRCWSSTDHGALAVAGRRLRRGCLAIVTTACLAGCTAGNDRLQIQDVLPNAEQAETLQLRIALPRRLREGLQRGVVLSWRLDLYRLDGGRESHWRELRYSPLSRQYQMHEPGSGYSRGYPSRAAALAALERWPLPPGPAALSARVRLDTTRLPAPLVLPALFDTDWHLDSGLATLANVHRTEPGQ